MIKCEVLDCVRLCLDPAILCNYRSLQMICATAVCCSPFVPNFPSFQYDFGWWRCHEFFKNGMEEKIAGLRFLPIPWT